MENGDSISNKNSDSEEHINRSKFMQPHWYPIHKRFGDSVHHGYCINISKFSEGERKALEEDLKNSGVTNFEIKEASAGIDGAINDKGEVLRQGDLSLRVLSDPESIWQLRHFYFQWASMGKKHDYESIVETVEHARQADEERLEYAKKMEISMQINRRVDEYKQQMEQFVKQNGRIPTNAEMLAYLENQQKQQAAINAKLKQNGMDK